MAGVARGIDALTTCACVADVARGTLKSVLERRLTVRLYLCHFVKVRTVSGEFGISSLSLIYFNMPALSKICPLCSSVEHCRRFVCKKCGYVFAKSAVVTKKTVVRQKRECEPLEESNKRKEHVRQCVARKRADETEHDTCISRDTNKQSMARKRARETEHYTCTRRDTNKRSMARKRATETEHDTCTRRDTNKQSMARKRAKETEHDTCTRRDTNKQNMARKRADETEHDTCTRRDANKQNMARKRADETEHDTCTRRDTNKQNMARKRADETEHETDKRRAKNRHLMANSRAECKPIDVVIHQFQTKVKLGPEYVCTCCHRMMYKQNVVPFKPTKYTKASDELLCKVTKHSYVSFDEWVCTTCNGSLCKGSLPAQSKANGMQVESVPPELSCLNPLELRLISLRVPFMKMVALPSGKQRCIHGPAVNVPSKLDKVCTMLPRLPSQCELVPLKLKRKLSYRAHYMYDYVSPEKVTNALKWLKANNPLYADVNIEDNWLDSALADDVELTTSMLEQPEAMDDSSNEPESNNHEQLVNTYGDNVSNDEQCISNPVIICTDMLKAFVKQYGFSVHDMPGDGDCLFSAVAYQLQNVGHNVNKSSLRQLVANYLSDHVDEYCPFVPEPLESNDGYNADNSPLDVEDEYIKSITDPVVQQELRWQKYLKGLRGNAWGDSIAIAAMCNMFDVS